MLRLASLPALAALAAASLSAHAADSINLGNYRVSATYSLESEIPGSTVSGLEASAVTYARDRGTLFFVGDEGTGVVEIVTSAPRSSATSSAPRSVRL